MALDHAQGLVQQLRAQIEGMQKNLEDLRTQHRTAEQRLAEAREQETQLQSQFEQV